MRDTPTTTSAPACQSTLLVTTMATIRERVVHLSALLAREREALAEFIADLADFDHRRCWEGLGYPSLFEFLVRELRLSRGNAFYRTKAVGLAQQFPEVLEGLREGKLCITAIAEVARVLTAENRAEVLPRFFHLSREDAKLLSAELIPREVVPTREMVTHAEVPNRAAPPVAPALTLVTADAPATTSIATPVPVHPVNCNDSKVLDRTGHAPAEARPDTTDPLTGQLSRLHITVTRELLARVEAAQIALSHARPGATIADLLELGADTALAQDAKRKGLVQKPRACRAETPPPGPESNHIPAHIRRAVWERDHGCCQWKLDNGEICGSRYRLQFDHIKPRAQGGHTTVANIRLLCQRHNLLAARVAYGEELMNRYRRLSVRDAAEGGRASALRRSKVQLAGAVSG